MGIRGFKAECLPYSSELTLLFDWSDKIDEIKYSNVCPSVIKKVFNAKKCPSKTDVEGWITAANNKNKSKDEPCCCVETFWDSEALA